MTCKKQKCLPFPLIRTPIKTHCRMEKMQQKMIFSPMVSKLRKGTAWTTWPTPWVGWPTFGVRTQRNSAQKDGLLMAFSDQKVLISLPHFRSIYIWHFFHLNLQSPDSSYSMALLFYYRPALEFALERNLLTGKWKSWQLFSSNSSDSNLWMRLRKLLTEPCSHFTWIKGSIYMLIQDSNFGLFIKKCERNI